MGPASSMDELMTTWQEQIKVPAMKLDEPKIHYPIYGVVSSGIGRLDKLLKNGNLLDPALVELPKQPGVLHHPINLPPAFSDVFFINAVKNRKRMIAIGAFYTTLPILLGLIWVSIAELMAIIAILAGAMFSYLLLDYYSVFRKHEDLAERCTYYGWIFSCCRPYLIITVVFFLASGITQFIIGGDDFLDQFGMYFDLPDNEYYRIFSGTLVHSQAAHYLANFSYAIAVSAICGPSLRMSFVPLFLIGGTASFGMTLLIEPYLDYPDSLGLVGTSGGISALLGGLIVLILKNPASYPKGLFYTIGFFFLLGFGLTTFFTSIISLSCHLFGALAGLIWGSFLPDYLSAKTAD